MPTLLARLRGQRLIESALRAPADVVAHLGAVQSQDYYGAAWAIGLRAPGVTAADVDAAYDAGRILRTHVLRPTWHFVTPADIGPWLALTGPRVQRVLERSGPRLGLNARVFTRARTVIERALSGGHHRTRAELAAALRQARVLPASAGGRAGTTGPVVTMTLAHLVMHAELAGAICSGRRRGKQFTYALMEERAPQAARAMREHRQDAALACLAERYFASRAPATVEDFTWWSGLTVRDARTAIAAAGLTAEPAPPPADRATGHHYLLPNFDEYVIAYRNRDALLDAARARNLGMLTTAHYPHFVILDGRIAGSWQREVKGDRVTVRLKLQAAPTASHRRRLSALADTYARFIGRPGAAIEPA